MKYSTPLKFIAVLLCAAALLGMVAGVGSVAALTGLNLYNRSVADYHSENLRENLQRFADQEALRYASQELGGCPETLVAERFTPFGSYMNYYYYDLDKVGYLLRDAEGNVVGSFPSESAVEAMKAGADSYTFTPQGQYMHLVEVQPTVQAQFDSQGGHSVDAQGRFYVNEIPEGGAEVYGVSAAFLDGTTNGVDDASDPLGYIEEQEDGTVVYEGSVFGMSGEVSTVEFRGEGGSVLYALAPGFTDSSAADEDAIGYFYSTDMHSGFRTYPAGGKRNQLFYGLVCYSVEGEELARCASTDPLGTLTHESNGSLTLELWEDVGLEEEMTALRAILVEDADGNMIVSVAALGVGQLVLVGNYIHYYPPTEPFTTPTEAPTEATVAASDTPPAPETAEDGEWVPEEGGEDGEDASSEEAQDGEVPAEEAQDEEVPPTERVWNEELDDWEYIPIETQPPETEAPETEPPTTAPPETVPQVTTVTVEIPEYEVTEPVMIDGKPLSEYGQQRMNFYDEETGETAKAVYVYVPLPEYTMEVYLAPGAERYGAMYTLLEMIHPLRNDMFLILAGCALVFAALMVYLCCAAGHKPRTEEIQAGGLNRVPLDLYLAATVGGVAFMVLYFIHGLDDVLERSIQTGLGLGAAGAYCACLLIVGFFFALAAQVKMGRYYWLTNSLCGRCVRLGVKPLRWGWHRALPWLWDLAKKALSTLAGWLRRGALGAQRAVERFLRLLPLTWQWILGGVAMVVICLLGAAIGELFGLFVAAILCFALIFYAAKCFGTLWEGTKRMSKGDLDTKIEDKRLAGCFQDFAGDLNALADVAVVAAQKQLKSERMKTELITNVSHDIKTPLTSIINYVDLLQKPHTEEEQEAYLEVLSRQSGRLKKLIEDLMDMSKASTGNMAVDITLLDAVEAVNQALGEFGDKLAAAQLTPVFRHEGDTVPMMADGKLVWRVMSNLLGNAVKYAMPGTRLYIDLLDMGDRVILSLKNISREELNVDAEELMERFVRGDDSRNTEGSGLGLNIAKSLMELQKGELQLLVDGDLFKVTLIFPGV